MDIYMAGSTFEELNSWMQERGYNKLFSQLNDRGEIELWVNHRKESGITNKLFIDSGAFTVHTKGATIDVDEYIEYLNSIEPYVTVYAQVDHIPGKWGRPRTQEELDEAPPKSWENYLYMRERLNNPDKLLPIFHQHEDFKYLRQMLEFTDKDGKHIPYIGISTNKDMPIQYQRQWLHDVFDEIVKSSNPNVKTHAFGLTSLNTLKLFPITSSDSTSWLRTATTGSIFTDYGTKCLSKETKHRKDNYANLDPLVQQKIKEIVESKGYNLEELIDNYRLREMWNVQYLQEWAANHTHKERDLTVKRLF